MKRYILLTLILLTFISLSAQSIAVKSFRPLPMDMTASSLEGKRVDQNGQLAALIKIVTSETGFTFEGGALGIVDTKQRNGEIWVWVPRASRKITILHQQLGVLRDYRYPIEIEAERTYEMVLTTGTVETIIKEEVRQQYLIFELEPKNATLEVNDKLWSVDAEGTALQFVDFGTYTYRVRAANYISDAGLVTVDDPDNPKTVKVKLKPDFAEVTLKVDADAEIWVNNEKKGTRTWTGPLGKGTYKIECKQEGHETTMISKEITTEMNGQTITLPTPIPVYGSLNVESTPIGATIFIDGKEVGKTPKSINEILVGEHEVKLVKEGYDDYAETVHIRRGERGQINAKLDVKHEKPIIDDLSANAIEEHNAPEGAINGLFSVSPTKQVWFSKGNLQYQASTNTWRFAENQWERIGFYNKYISRSYSGYIDLFGWGTSGWNCGNSYYKPWCYYETEGEKYGPKGANNLTGKYSKSDWGLNNKIVNGGNIIGQWRTLEEAEWKYLLFDRNTASGIRFARAMVNNGSGNVFGIIIIPDDWDESIYALHKTNVDREPFNNDYNHWGHYGDGANIITYEDWVNLFEANGAVFLPAAGYRKGKSFEGNFYNGSYWSASDYDGIHAYHFSFDEYFFQVSHGDDRFYGLSVRLVQDYKSSKK